MELQYILQIQEAPSNLYTRRATPRPSSRTPTPPPSTSSPSRVLTFRENFYTRKVSKVTDILPNMIDPRPENPIEIIWELGCAKLPDATIAANNEFMKQWETTSKELFSFLLSNCQEVKYLLSGNSDDRAQSAMKSILTNIMPRRTLAQTRKLMTNKLPAPIEERSGPWFPALCAITAKSKLWTEHLRQRSITTLPWMDKGATFQYLLLMSAQLAKNMLLPVISNGSLKSGAFLTMVPPGMILPTLGHRRVDTTDNLALLKLQVNIIAGFITLEDVNPNYYFNQNTNKDKAVFLDSNFNLTSLKIELYRDIKRNDRSTLTEDTFHKIFSQRPSIANWRNFYSSIRMETLFHYNRRIMNLPRNFRGNFPRRGKYGRQWKPACTHFIDNQDYTQKK